MLFPTNFFVPTVNSHQSRGHPAQSPYKPKEQTPIGKPLTKNLTHFPRSPQKPDPTCQNLLHLPPMKSLLSIHL